MTINHKFYLDLAFQLAESNLGNTGLNPSVGTVIVKNNSVISSGVTSLNGRPHAEFNALKKGNFFKGAYLYSTLEPCTHYGLTPPCVNIIKKKKLKMFITHLMTQTLEHLKRQKIFLIKKKLKQNY